MREYPGGNEYCILPGEEIFFRGTAASVGVVNDIRAFDKERDTVK